MEYNRTLDVIARPDVLVVGAGCAGTVAAISAARAGASTLVVERGGFAGGYITGVVGASLDGFVDLRSGLPVVGGVVFDLARAAASTTATGDLASPASASTRKSASRWPTSTGTSSTLTSSASSSRPTASCRRPAPNSSTTRWWPM